MLTVYHYNKCSKSREVCSIIAEKGIKVTIIEYLKTPFTEKILKDLLKKLGMKAEEIVRKKEPLFLEKFQGKKLTEVQWIKVLVKNPILIERPIILKGNKAIIGRPPSSILKLL